MNEKSLIKVASKEEEAYQTLAEETQQNETDHVALQQADKTSKPGLPNIIVFDDLLNEGTVSFMSPKELQMDKDDDAKVVTE